MKWFTFFLVVLAGASSANAADPEVLVNLYFDDIYKRQSVDHIYEGESVLYRVTLNHVENPSPPKLEGFSTDFDVESRGEQPIDSHMVEIVNGRRTEIVRRGRFYDFALTPKRSGESAIPAPVAEVDGQVLRGKPMTLLVIAPPDQETAILEIQADKTSVYATQAFTVTLTIAVKELSIPYEAQDPVEVLRRCPRLTIPWIDDESLPAGIQAKQPVSRWLSPYLHRRGLGFSINNIPASSGFSLFSRDAPAGFKLKSTRIQRKNDSGKTSGYRQYTLGRTFVPTQLGEFSFGPVSLKGDLPIRVDRSAHLELDEIFTVAPAVIVTVKDAPLEGRPATYAGAIGRFTWDGQLAPTEAKTGDPLTLTLTLSGNGTLDTVQTPDLTNIPELAEAFKIYEATEESGAGQRRFIFGLRPLRAGTKAFPAVPMSYFDPHKEEYVTLTTNEIPIRIDAAEQLAEGDIDVAAGTSAPGGSEIETQAGGIFANDSALQSLRDDSVDPRRWFAGLGTLAGVYVIAVLVSGRVRRLAGDPDLMRRRMAARARQRLRGATASNEDNSTPTDRLQAAVFGLVADAAGIPEAGLTSSEVGRRLEQLQVDDALADRFARWCESCDAARYGASTDDVHQLEQQAETLLEDMIVSLKRQKAIR